MTLCTKIQQFLNLEETLDMEAEKIFHPILAEVERQDKKFLLFPPVMSTLWVEWLVVRPKTNCYLYYSYLVLMIQPAPETNEIDLVLASREDNLPDGYFMENYGETPRSFYKKLKERTTPDFPVGLVDGLPTASEEPEEDETDEIEGEWSTPEELKRFFLKAGINPAVMAKIILTNARKSHSNQKIRLPKGRPKVKKPSGRPCLQLIK